MDLKLHTRDAGDATVVEVGGEVELYSAQQLREELMRACEMEHPCIVVDLSCVSFIDSTGLGVLVGALKRVSERGTLALVCPQQRVRRVLAITGLIDVFPMYNALEDAVAACSTSPTGHGCSIQDDTAVSGASSRDGIFDTKVTLDESAKLGGDDG